MTLLRPLVHVAMFAITLGLLYSAKVILVPIALAVLLSFILNPLVMRLQRWHLNRIAAVALVSILGIALLGVVGTAITLQFKELGEQLPQYHENIARKIAAFREAGKGNVLEKVQEAVNVIEDRLKKEDGPRTATPEPVPVQVIPSGFTEFGKFLGPALETLATTGLVVALLIFILIYREDLRDRMVRLIGHGRLPVTTRAIDEATQRISRYLFTQFAINAGFGAALGIGLFCIGLPYALLWGALAAVLRFIPFVGGWLLGALVSAVAVAVFPTWTQPIIVLALVAGLELLTSQLAEPLLVGHSTGTSPVALIVAAAFWTWLWGPIGLALSTPLTTCLVVLGKYVPHLEFLGILLGDEEVLEADAGFYQRLLARDQDEAVELVEEYLKNHPVEAVYDDLLVRAIVLAKHDRARDELTTDDEQAIYQMVRDIINDVLPSPPSSSDEEEAMLADVRGGSISVLGCAARDEADELALYMFGQVLRIAKPAAYVEVLSARLPIGEMIARIKTRPPMVLVIAAVPPGGLAQVRYLCKRVRTALPGKKILIGRWGGPPEHAERVREHLLDACADMVATSIVDSRNQCLSLLPAADPQRATAAHAAVGPLETK